jgi:hypothetical protein
MIGRRLTLAAALVLLVAPVLATAGGAAAGPTPARAPAGPPVVKVGAASRSILPTVDGSHDYLADVHPDPDEPYSPGLPVSAWDQGRVAVGNGDSNAYWVHDDMEVTAIAFEDLQTRRLTVVVAANLYMIFRPDADAIRAAVADRLDAETVARLDVAIHADHNHHGPDTSFDVNHEWYDLMIGQAADAVVEALAERRPARLEVAQTEHYFGLRDSRDAQVLDPTLGVLRAEATNGETIATMIFWANHPEVTLFWSPPQAAITDDCVTLGIEADCSAQDRYFTADFPGWATRIVEEQLGGEAAYFNGAIGSLVTPLGAAVWEVTDQHPVGDGFTVPEGAAPPEGAANHTERNFRRTYLVGRELAVAALAALDGAEAIRRPTVSYDVQPFYTRMTNIGFRALLVRGADGWTSLGHTPAELYTCPATGPKTADTCTPDAYATAGDPVVGTIRVGDHTRSEVARLRIGPIGMMWLPAEMSPESTIGLPAGYDATPDDWHLDDPDLHAFGAEYTTNGYVKNRMDEQYRWVVGLGNDELGYAVPISDYRVYCVADALTGQEGTCAQLHALGVIEYPDAVAGTTCKAITEDPSLLAAYGAAAEAVAGSCRYGQVIEEAEDHYEETNSLGWDLEGDILAAVASLTGNDDPQRINPDFPGWWSGLTP